MKRTILILSMVALAVAFSAESVLAQRGRIGRAGPSLNRGPTLNRSTLQHPNVPSLPGRANPTAGLPGRGGANPIGPSHRPALESPRNVQDFLDLPSRGEVSNFANRAIPYSAYAGHMPIPGNVPAHPPGWHPWYHHPGYYHHGYWWRPATAAAVTGWVVFGWAQPYYYDYGSGGNVYYENNTVYMDGEPYASAAEYYNQANRIADEVPDIDDQQADQLQWMPLGVFAMTDSAVGSAKMTVQLAVSKEGILAGTLRNDTTGATYPVEGTVDKQTQRAVWKIADGTDPNLVMETGIYNLTQDQTPVLVHFGPDKTETWTMVRQQEPETSQP